MAINKVIYNNKTLIDLTNDTITPDKLVSGATAHSASGETITGTLKPVLGDAIAPEYREDGIYGGDARVMHNGLLYRCICEISKPEKWTPEHWETVSVTALIAASTQDVLQKVQDMVSVENGTLVYRKIVN